MNIEIENGNTTKHYYLQDQHGHHLRPRRRQADLAKRNGLSSATDTPPIQPGRSFLSPMYRVSEAPAGAGWGMYKPGYDTFGLSDAEPADPAGTNRACHPANLHDAGKVRGLIRENLVGLDTILLEAKGKEHAPIPMGIKIQTTGHIRQNVIRGRGGSGVAERFDAVILGMGPGGEEVAGVCSGRARRWRWWSGSF